MEFLLLTAMGKPVWMWLAFLALVFLLLAFDLGVLHRKSHEIGIRESLWLSAFYITLGLLFSGWIWWYMGEGAAINYLTGFVVEKSLAMDNIFVIAMIFGFFAIPRAYQHRVLVYGILGVVILRGIMIFAGAAIVQQFEWVLYIFGAFLVFTGVRMLMAADTEYDVANNPVLTFMRRHFNVTRELHGQRFFVWQKVSESGRRALFITPLLLALVMVEIADVIFAVDSIPAIFAITTDPYVVFTSNIFAILGLRALYFALSAMLHRFELLKYALSLVLVFIGAKIVVEMLGLVHIEPLWSLGATLSILGGGVVASLWQTRKAPPETTPVPALPGPAAPPEGLPDTESERPGQSHAPQASEPVQTQQRAARSW